MTTYASRDDMPPEMRPDPDGKTVYDMNSGFNMGRNYEQGFDEAYHPKGPAWDSYSDPFAGLDDDESSTVKP